MLIFVSHIILFCDVKGKIWISVYFETDAWCRAGMYSVDDNEKRQVFSSRGGENCTVRQMCRPTGRGGKVAGTEEDSGFVHLILAGEGKAVLRSCPGVMAGLKGMPALPTPSKD
jgi:hypothetical protein